MASDVGNQAPRRRNHVRWIVNILVLWQFGKCVGCVLAIPQPWGPKVEGRLPDGGIVYFQARQRGRETDDRLTWTTSAGKRSDFMVDQIHAGFEYVTIKRTNDATGVWVESYGRVGASLDLTTGEFFPEGDRQFPWAKLGTGVKIAEGWTFSWFEFVRPW